MEVSRVSTLASPSPDLLALPWQLRQLGIMFPGTIDIDVLHYLVGLLVPLVFKRDTAVYLFSRLSSYWVTKLQRGVLMHPALGSFQHHSGVGLQCLGPIPADLASSPCWPWGSPIHRIFIVKGSVMEKWSILGIQTGILNCARVGKEWCLRQVLKFIHSFISLSGMNIIRNAIYCKVSLCGF